MDFWKFLAIGVGIVVLIVLAAFAFFVPVQVDTSTDGPSGPVVSGLLIRGAACEQDSDCVYAVNAYPTLRCVSPNCPPEEMDQPASGDPAYEWIESYHDECVNFADLEGKNELGEDLLVESRGVNCTCEPIAPRDGAITSVSGQKVCVKHTIE